MNNLPFNSTLDNITVLDSMSACHKEVASAANGPKLIGAFVPKCEDDGSYKKIQCHGSTGYCWCVNDEGVKQAGTEKRGRPDCGTKSGLVYFITIR